MSRTNVVYPFTIQSVDMAGISAITWVPFDINGFSYPCFMLHFINNSDSDVFLSFDGVHKHEILPALEKIEIKLQTNAAPGNYVSLIPKGSKVYVQGVANPGSCIYLESYYCKPVTRISI